MEGGLATADYIGQTILHPLALAVMLVLSLLVLVLPARYALISLLVAATTLPVSQRIIIGGANLTLMRLLLLAYLLRVLFRKESRDFKWGGVDTAVLLWPLVGTAIMTIHFGTVDAFVNRAGWAFDVLLTYFVTRCLIRSTDDLLCLCKVIAVISVPVAATFLMEYFTQHNPYAIFGGVRPFTWIREGRMRCQGAFTHPIMAGSFWASMIPMLWMLRVQQRSSRRLATLGIGAALVIIFACGSSTPLLSVLVAVTGIILFVFRRYRTYMWVGLLALLIGLQLVMKAPVWHLMSRVDLVGGSTGWWRYRIFDAFINNFHKWFLTGEDNPMSWGVMEMRDITNQFILEGLFGGLLTLVIFIMILICCFQAVGRALKEVGPRNDVVAEWGLWLIGVTIFVHVVTFLGVSYHGQITAIMYIHFAIAGAVLPQLLPRILASTEGDVANSPKAKPAGRLRLGARRSIAHSGLQLRSARPVPK